MGCGSSKVKSSVTPERIIGAVKSAPGPVTGIKTNTVAPMSNFKNQSNNIPDNKNGPVGSKSSLTASSFTPAPIVPITPRCDKVSLSRRISPCPRDRVEEKKTSKRMGSPESPEGLVGSGLVAPREEQQAHEAHESGLLHRDVKNIVNPNNMIAAVKRGDLEAVQALAAANDGNTQNGINALGMWNSSPLMIAVQYGRKDIVRFILGRPEVQIDHVNDNGVTALLLACSDGQTDSVQRLLELGVNSNPAVARGFYNQQIDKSIFATPFSVAVMNGHDAVVEAMINAGHSVNSTFPFPFSVSSTGAAEQLTPMMLACLYGKTPVLKTLLSYTADCAVSDSTHSNMLHYAAKAGGQAVGVFALLKLTVNDKLLRKLVRALDTKGCSPLHNACYSNQVDIIEILLKLGSDANVQTKNKLPISSNIPFKEKERTKAPSLAVWGVTPLHIAVKRRSEEIVLLLLRAKANPLLRDENDVTTLDLANKLRNDSVIRMKVNEAAELYLKKERDAEKLKKRTEENSPIVSEDNTTKIIKTNKETNIIEMKEQERSETDQEKEDKGEKEKEDCIVQGAPPTPRSVQVEGEIDERVMKIMQRAVSNIVQLTMA